MAAIWVRAGAELRRRWRGAVVLAVLVGIAGGAAIAGVAGARRTESALARFVAYSRPVEVFILKPEGGLDVDAVARLPQVADVSQSAYALLTPSTASGRPDIAALGSINPFVRTSERGLGTTTDIPYLVEGRPADPDRALEVMVNEEVAEEYELRPGDTLRMWAYTPEQLDADLLQATTEPAGRAFDFTVIGVIRLPFDLDPTPRDPEVAYTGRGTVLLGPAFWEHHGDEVAAFGGDDTGLDIRLHPGSDVQAFERAVRALPGGNDLEIQVGSEAARVQKEAEQATDVEAGALVAFAALAAVAGLLVVGQGLARQMHLEGAEHGTLLALGMTWGQVLAASLLRALAIAVPGGLLAGAVAVAASPLAPIGLARRAEIDPGVAVDPPVLAAGMALVAVAVVVRAALAAWRPVLPAGGPAPASRGRPSALQRLAGAGAPPTAVARLAMALDRRRGAGPSFVGTAAIGALVAVAVITAALTFGASLHRLATTPELQGWNWDVVVGNPNAEEDLASIGPARLAAQPFVDGFTAVSDILEPLTIGGLDIRAAGVDLVTGDVFSPMAEGRPPRAPGEVVLGGRTMERLGLAVGGRVEGRLGGQDLSLHVVGRAVLNAGLQFFFTMDEGAVLSFEELRRLGGDLPTTHFLVRYVEGVDEAAAFDALQADWGKTVLRPQTPVEVGNLRRVSGLPFVLAGGIAVLAVATLAHATATSVRRRRGELAVLKALGFLRRQVAATVGWQATTVVVVALAFGLPLGVAAGRWAWQMVASGMGAPGAVTPVLAGLLIVPAALAVANVVAAIPARAAGHVRPAIALRAE